MAEWIRALKSSSDASVQQSVGLNPGRDTCVPEQDTCCSPPRGKLVPVRAELVLVIDLAELHICTCCAYSTPGS